MSYIKGAKMGSEGNTRLQSSYGGGSTAPRQSYPKGYATGGAIRSANPALEEGLSASGAPAKATFGRGKKVGTKKPKANAAGPKINIVIAQAPKEDKMAMAPEGMPPMPPGGPPPMAGPPPGPPPGPPMPPPGAPPMRAFGGKVVARKTGGRVHGKKDGGEETGKDVGMTPGMKMRALQKQDKQDMSSAGQALTAAGTGALAAALTRKDGGLGKVINKAGKIGLGAGLFGTGAAVARGAENLAKREELGKGKAVEGEEDGGPGVIKALGDFKKGGKVCKQDGGGLSGKKRLQKEGK